MRFPKLLTTTALLATVVAFVALAPVQQGESLLLLLTLVLGGIVSTVVRIAQFKLVAIASLWSACFRPAFNSLVCIDEDIPRLSSGLWGFTQFNVIPGIYEPDQATRVGIDFAHSKTFVYRNVLAIQLAGYQLDPGCGLSAQITVGGKHTYDIPHIEARQLRDGLTLFFAIPCDLYSSKTHNLVIDGLKTPSVAWFKTQPNWYHNKYATHGQWDFCRHHYKIWALYEKGLLLKTLFTPRSALFQRLVIVSSAYATNPTCIIPCFHPQPPTPPAPTCNDNSDYNTRKCCNAESTFISSRCCNSDKSLFADLPEFAQKKCCANNFKDLHGYSQDTCCRGVNGDDERAGNLYNVNHCCAEARWIVEDKCCDKRTLNKMLTNECGKPDKTFDSVYLLDKCCDRKWYSQSFSEDFCCNSKYLSWLDKDDLSKCCTRLDRDNKWDNTLKLTCCDTKRCSWNSKKQTRCNKWDEDSEDERSSDSSTATDSKSDSVSSSSSTGRKRTIKTIKTSL